MTNDERLNLLTYIPPMGVRRLQYLTIQLTATSVVLDTDACQPVRAVGQ